MTSIKGHNSVTNLRKMTGNNLDLDLINQHTKFGQFLTICSQDIEQKRNSERNSDIFLFMSNNTNLDLVSINAYTKFGKMISICSQDNEQKRNYDRWTE